MNFFSQRPLLIATLLINFQVNYTTVCWIKAVGSEEIESNLLHAFCSVTLVPTVVCVQSWLKHTKGLLDIEYLFSKSKRRFFGKGNFLSVYVRLHQSQVF